MHFDDFVWLRNSIIRGKGYKRCIFSFSLISSLLHNFFATFFAHVAGGVKVKFPFITLAHWLPGARDGILNDIQMVACTEKKVLIALSLATLGFGWELCSKSVIQ